MILLELFIISAFVVNDFGLHCSGEKIELSLRNFTNSDEEVVDEEKILSPNSEIEINIIDVPDEIGFVILQLHSYLNHVTLSYDAILNFRNHVNGSNIGLTYFFDNFQSTATFFVQNLNSANVSVLIVIVPYSDSSPVPGGCNMVLPTAIAPYLLLKENNAITTVEGTLAAHSKEQNDCNRNSLTYDMFYMYSKEWDFSKENYFESIRNMLTYPRILKNALKTEIPAAGSILRRYFNVYTGTGATYALIVFNKLGQAAAYTPIYTFGCENNNIEACESPSVSLTRTYVALITGFNLLLCFAGHRFFLFELFFVASEIGFLITFILLLQRTSYSGDLFVISLAIGFVTGVVWLGFWWCISSPFLMILFPFLLSNFIIYSTVYLFFLGNMAIFRSDINCWSSLIGVTVIAILILTTNPVFFNMISCAVIGAYGSVIPIDYYLGSNLKYIIINVIRRATVENFNLAITEPPFEFRDLSILLLWICLIYLGYRCQKWLSINRPPFPPKCYLLRQHNTERDPLITTHRPFSPEIDPYTTAYRIFPSERDPYTTAYRIFPPERDPYTTAYLSA